MASPEQYRGSQEHTVELESAAAERKAELQKLIETKSEDTESSKDRLEQARAEASREALPAEQHRDPKDKETQKNPAYHAMSRDENYNLTMRGVQQRMSPSSRMFSKIIHNKKIEKASDLIGATLARPNAILAGAFTAFVAVLGVYVLAKYMGFSLRGSETIAAFIIGWLVGVVFYILRSVISGKR